MKKLLRYAAVLLLLSTIVSQSSTVFAQGSAFTYQGRLNNGTNPASGLYDFQFVLSNAPSGGSQIGSPITRLDVGVTNGLFVTTLDFTNVFGGQDAWLGISVRTNGAATYTALTPLQHITPTPYAIYAESASAAGLSGTIASANLPGGLGGNGNTASAPGATVGGGDTNLANGGDATVSGGALNVASGGDATVAGGLQNTASGNLATVPGGAGNKASGNFSFAAGHDAQATNDGAFVWADSQAVNFASTNNDSFNVRAQGGVRFVTGGANLTTDGKVGIGTNSPTELLTIANVTNFNSGLKLTGTNASAIGMALENTSPGGHKVDFLSTGSGAAAGAGAFVILDETLGVNRFTINSNGFVGINTPTPVSQLQVNGTVTATAFSGDASGLTNFSTAQLTSIGNGNSGSAGNFFVGTSGNSSTTGSDNTVVGDAALNLNTSGSYNTALGLDTLSFNNSGSYNTAIGLDALHFNSTGTNNTALGFRAGFNLSGGNNNIYIGNYGLSTENNTIRIGTPGVQSTTFLSGNVAIGTTSPGAVLDANITSAAGSGTLIAQLGSPAGPRIQFFDDSPVFGLGPRINFNDSNPGVLQGNGNIALLPTGSVGVNTTTPNSDSQLQVKGMVRMGSETGTSQAPGKSILLRRINSTSSATGQVLARSVSGGNTMTLERDGTAGGLVIKVTGTSGGAPQITGFGINSSNTTVTVYSLLLGGGNNTTNQIFTDAQKIGYCRLMFGDAFNDGDTTTVEMIRAVDNGGNNTTTWVGTVTSTVNQ